MIDRYFKITVLMFILLLFVLPLHADNQKTKIDNYTALITDIQSQILTRPDGKYVPPTENELREWVNIFNYFRRHAFDSCKVLLEKFDYTYSELKDDHTGYTYDIIKEKAPARRGWGTFIYNRNHTKRLYVDISHPFDDQNVLAVGGELFRRAQAEWLLIAGTGKRASKDVLLSDIARAPRSLFQTWHQLLTDATHLTISLHGYNKSFYKYPVSATDIVLSNGPTTDEQWGISQISLAFRDSLRGEGFISSVAMFDSGYGALSAIGNYQATFSNDNVGFGHWINIELSNTVRDNPSDVLKFIAVVDRSLDLTGKKVFRQLNKTFGLASPRVVRIDSTHKILFAPPSRQTYRIISFNTGTSKNDTMNIRMGNLLSLFGSEKSMARITEIDSSERTMIEEFERTHRSGSHTTVASIVDPSSSLSSVLHRTKESISDSSLTDENSGDREEPLQVRRIPLSEYGAIKVANHMVPEVTTYRWEGVISEKFLPKIQILGITGNESVFRDENEMPSFLIPIISNSYHNGQSKFIGIQMTKVLVQEIARLVTEQHDQDMDVSLVAEESQNGSYYLRVVPNASQEKLAEVKR